jgi:hypothetical protein
MIEYIKIKIFEFLNDEISFENFEKWIYEDPELEKCLNKDIYLNLISLNFKNNKFILHEIKTLFSKLFDLEEFDYWQVQRVLKQLIDDKIDPIDASIKLHGLYCEGFKFLYDFTDTYQNKTWNLLLQKQNEVISAQVFEERKEVLSEWLKADALYTLNEIKANKIKIVKDLDY